MKICVSLSEKTIASNNLEKFLSKKITQLQCHHSQCVKALAVDIQPPHLVFDYYILDLSYFRFVWVLIL